MPRKRKKRKTQHTKPRNGSIGRTNWDGLSRDLMLKILATLNPVDLIFGASLVCHSWRSLCWEVLFVKENNTFDFTALKFLSRFGKGATGSDLMAWLRIFENVMESYHDVDDDGVCSVTSIIFPYGLHLFDNHLVYLAQSLEKSCLHLINIMDVENYMVMAAAAAVVSSSKLKTLYLPCSTKITGKGFSRAIRNWKKLEEILIGPIEISYIDHIFQEMGINCKRLEILCLSQTRLDEYTAVVIAKNLRELKEVLIVSVSSLEPGGKGSTYLVVNITSLTHQLTISPHCDSTSAQFGLTRQNNCSNVSSHLQWCLLRGLVNFDGAERGRAAIGEEVQESTTGVSWPTNNRPKRTNTAEQWLQERTRRYGPIWKLSIFGTPTVFLQGQVANKFVSTCDGSLLSSKQPVSIRRLWGERNLLEMSGDDHKGALLSFLKPEALKQNVTKMDEEIRIELDMYWHGKEEVKVMPLAKILTFNIMASLLFGMERGTRRDKFIELFHIMLEGTLSLPINLPFTRFNRSIKAHVKIKSMVMDLLREKRAGLEQPVPATSQDLITCLLSLPNEDNSAALTDEEILDNCVVTLVAGHETTSVLITFLVRLLAGDPSVYALVAEEQEEIAKRKALDEPLTWDDLAKMKYTWRVAIETPRMTSPVFCSFRRALQDIEFGGYHS
ncbi:LOW QUALITY PROTEIN: Cytochrome P450 [Dillenia turbinata]|uniref:Cytochrome P450 n=1 Tax=Dillenia turbinata TaxID=194707 RepID=A0AAN8UWS1_9MAGN